MLNVSFVANPSQRVISKIQSVIPAYIVKSKCLDTEEEILEPIKAQGVWIAYEDTQFYGFAVGLPYKQNYIVQHLFCPHRGREFYGMMSIEQPKLLFFTYRNPEAWNRFSDLEVRPVGYLLEVVK